MSEELRLDIWSGIVGGGLAVGFFAFVLFRDFAGRMYAYLVLFSMIALGYVFGDEEGRAKMSWLQKFWIGAAFLAVLAGIVASNGELLQAGVAGFIGFFVGWTRPEKL